MIYIRFYDACCGIGGFTQALTNIGFQCVGACEIDKFARHVYESHFGEISHRDIKLLDIQSLPDFDLLTAGFPCQPYSTAGKCKGWNDCRIDVFQQLIRIIKFKQPRFVLFENTSGLLNHDNGSTFWKILLSLWKCGYDAQWEIIDSQCVVPQKRKRLYIVASLAKERIPTIFPLSCFSGTNTQAANQGKGSQPTHTKQKWGKEIQKKTRYRTNYKGEYWFLNSAFLKDVKKNRLRLRSVTPTLTTCPSKDFAIITNGNARILTPTECERLMGFPDDWTASLTADSRRYKLIGNSVTVQIVERIGMALKEALVVV